MDKIPKFKVGQCDLDYIIFDLLLYLIFYSLQSIYVQNLHPIASAVQEILTWVSKIKI